MKSHNKHIFTFVIAFTIINQSSAKKSTTEPKNINTTRSITNPQEGSAYTIGDTVSISATAVDEDGSITHVNFYIRGELCHTDFDSPYTYEWDTSDESIGAYSIYAKAFDEGGADGISSIIEVNIEEPELTLEEELQLILDERIDYFGVNGASVAIMLYDNSVIKLASGISEPGVAKRFHLLTYYDEII